MCRRCDCEQFSSETVFLFCFFMTGLTRTEAETVNSARLLSSAQYDLTWRYLKLLHKAAGKYHARKCYCDYIGTSVRMTTITTTVVILHTMSQYAVLVFLANSRCLYVLNIVIQLKTLLLSSINKSQLLHKWILIVNNYDSKVICVFSYFVSVAVALGYCCYACLWHIMEFKMTIVAVCFL